MARSLWSGSLSFGLVNVPVQLLSATRDRQIHFHQLDEADNTPIEVRRFCGEEDVEVSYDEVASGYELEDGKWVMLTDDELAAAQPEKTKTIDIDQFVELADVDPIYFDHPYLLVPTGGEGASRAYELLARVMDQEGRIALGRFVLRNKEYLAAIRPREGRLMLTTMAFADEVRPTDPVVELVGSAKAPKKEVDAAVELIEAMATDWDPTAYEDRHRERMRKVIEAKGEGAAIEAPEEEEAPSQVPDLMAALEATLAKAKAGSGGGGAPREQGQTKEELLERAKELDISGRSKMNKEELAEAIAGAE
ncbi:MAG: end-binding protein Ku [Thermoleophilaceae bacterium]|jgi:DNA end-binding protein Ku|nr:end-binding protein Ku [Thermoleophilaceae bacterium]